MKLQCNLDGKGKAIRLIWGMTTMVLGVLGVVFWAWPGGGWVAWLVSGVLIGLGGFGIFEARTGWCVVRAMGVKTRY